MKPTAIAVSVDHLEEDLHKVRDLAVILNTHMLDVHGIPARTSNALSHLTIEIVGLAERMQGHVTAAFDAARQAREAGVVPMTPARCEAETGERVPAVGDLCPDDLLTLGGLLLPVAKLLTAARGDEDLSDEAAGYLGPLREVIDDAFHAIIERVEAMTLPALLVDERFRLLLGNALYREETAPFIAQLAAELVRSEEKPS